MTKKICPKGNQGNQWVTNKVTNLRLSLPSKVTKVTNFSLIIACKNINNVLYI